MTAIYFQMAYKKIVFILQKHVCLVDMVSTCAYTVIHRLQEEGEVEEEEEQKEEEEEQKEGQRPRR